MKKWILLLVVTISLSNCSNETEITSKLAGIKLTQIKGESTIDYDFLKETNGKIVIIEFWETWCGPCIEGMHHLKELKNKFPDKLKIVCISSDKFDETTKFINKNSYPFDFIYDKEKQLSKLFPHSAIPFSVFINNKGKILSKTYPGLITENVIKKIIEGDSINVPKVKNLTSDSILNSLSVNKFKNPLISFQLSHHELGDQSTVSNFKIPKKRTIVTGYTGNTYKDTTEIIQIFRAAKKNILQIYMNAYNNEFIESRFIYTKDLNYINSYRPNNLYRVSFEASSILGDFNILFVNQLNNTFGFKTSIIEKEIVYFELINIELKKDTIMSSENPSVKITGNSMLSSWDFKVSQICSAKEIANLVENQLRHFQWSKYHNVKEKIIYYPVMTELSNDYALNISIEEEILSLEKWISIFKQNGLTLVKKKGKVKYIKIQKLSN